jgi:hypothetical protein
MPGPLGWERQGGSGCLSTGYADSAVCIGERFMTPSNDSLAAKAASVELLVLASAQRGGSSTSPQGYLLSPRRSVTDRAGAIEVLAQIPKPADCAASLVDGVFVITCHAIEGEALEQHQLQVEARERMWTLIAGVNMEKATMLLIGGGDSLTIPGEVFRRWYRDYTWPPMLAASERPPSETEGARGITIVLSLSPVTVIEPDSVLRQLRDSIVPPQGGTS